MAAALQRACNRQALFCKRTQHTSLLMPTWPHWLGSKPSVAPVALASLPTDDVEHLLELPDELLILCVVDHMLSASSGDELLSALRLAATCSEMASRLSAVTKEVHSRRMQWVTEHSDLNVTPALSAVISSTGRQWKSAFCEPLPTEGRSSWTLSTKASGGYLHVGVCTADGACAWGVAAYSGHALRTSWDRASGTMLTDGAAGLPEGSANGVDFGGVVTAGSHLLDAHGRHTTLKSGAATRSISVTVDHSDGTMSVTVDGRAASAASCEVRGFPPGAQLRPWVALYHKGDRVGINRAW